MEAKGKGKLSSGFFAYLWRQRQWRVLLVWPGTFRTSSLCMGRGHMTTAAAFHVGAEDEARHTFEHQVYVPLAWSTKLLLPTNHPTVCLHLCYFLCRVGRRHAARAGDERDR